ncbi:MAG TPA: VWA-like domain-containing protein [Burkholderiaceae bacterium]|nr:VWA-like domain-containing protein [Burkholderiaceae bacterium]
MSQIQSTRARVERVLRLVNAPLPHLAGLVAAARVSIDERVPTMGVFASGRLVVNPGFVARLNDRDLLFVLAHEMLHLALRTHDRAKGAGRTEFNYAHDYIINDILRSELGVAVIPASGLDMPGAKVKSAEQIVLEMRRRGDSIASRSQVWEGQPISAGQRFPGEPGSAGEHDGGDVLDGAVERDWYPGEAATQRNAAERVKALAARALSLAEAMEAMRGMRGTTPAAATQNVIALRGLYRTPWQLALQRWMASVAPGERTFTRASRRNAPQTDVVLPGRRREGWLLNVVLDTSASMSGEIATALGAVADYCDAASVDQVRLVQCDAGVTADEFLEPDALAEHEIAGYGGSDLSPALLHLADDATTRAAVVITDGDIEYPRQPMPYEILWVLAPRARAQFAPPYGRVVSMT